MEYWIRLKKKGEKRLSDRILNNKFIKLNNSITG